MAFLLSKEATPMRVIASGERTDPYSVKTDTNVSVGIGRLNRLVHESTSSSALQSSRLTATRVLLANYFTVSQIRAIRATGRGPLIATTCA